MLKQIIYISSLLLVPVFLISLSPTKVYADHCGDMDPRTQTYQNCIAEHGGQESEQECAEGEVQTSFDITGDGTCVPENQGGAIEDNPIVKMIATIVRFLSVGVGIVVTISIVVAGIQYISSQGNPQATQAAQGRLTNAIIALLLFIFMTVIINFLVPGGVF